MEAYIDDILVKSQSRKDYLAHLREAFYLLWKHWLWLNPTKCAFSASSGNFLGFLVSLKGIKMEPGQIRAITQLRPLTSKKEIQSLTGRLAALNRFILQYSDHL